MKLKNVFKMGITFAIAGTLCFQGAFTNSMIARASYEIQATVPKAALADVLKPYKVNPGDVVDVVIPVKASNFMIRKPIINVDLTRTQGFSLVSDAIVTDKAGNKIETIAVAETVYVRFSVKIPLNAKKGTFNDIPITFITTDSFNDYAEVTLDQVSKLTFVVGTQKNNANFTLIEAEYPDEIRDNEDVNLNLIFKNTGELVANNVSVSLSGFENILINKEGISSVNIGDVEGDSFGEAKFRFRAAKNLSTSLVQLVATVKYENMDGTQAEPQNFNIALQTIAESSLAEEASNRPVIEVSGVTYPQYTVTAGKEFDISCTITNKSKAEAKKIVVDMTGYSELGFKPKKVYDKVRINSLKPNESYTITRSFIATETVATGIRPILVSYSYYSAKDQKLSTQISDSINIYIETKGKEAELNNELNNSIPRLTVSKYDTGNEKIMAGKVFDFSFDVLNTHTSATADNIVVTISSPDNSFSIIEGSASILINSLKPGEIRHCTIPLRAKGDIPTNGYDLVISFDYEYLTKDVANNNALIKKPNKIEEKLKLQVYSNDRPMLSNISVGAGETPIYGEATAVTFDFNNMGKSPLYNVTAKVSGDFKPMNEILIIGNVEAGAGRSWSIDVTPEVENYGKGVLTISYEDSNGNVSSYDTDFESVVLEPSNNNDVPDFPVTPVIEGPKEIIPMWLFVIGEIAIFIIGVQVVKKKAIAKYKKKKLEEVMKEDEES